MRISFSKRVVTLSASVKVSMNCIKYLIIGMFMTKDETRCLWFNPSADEDLDREYTLIGILFGLAIYNSVMLDIKFPPVLYRKLMGKIGSFEDLETSDPVECLFLENEKSFLETDFLL